MVLRRALVLAFLPAFGALFLPPAGVAQKRPRWLVSTRILVRGDLQNQDCRTGVCKHNENT